jgi:hypothetical protein
MQAILTSTGSRVIASCAAKRMTVSWDHGLSVPDNHAAAAEKLRSALDWKGELAHGCLPDGSYAHVFK